MKSLQQIEYGAQGYGSYFVLSIMDKYYKKDLSFEEGKALMKRCMEEVQRRLLLNTPNFVVKVVDKEGTRRISLQDVKVEDNQMKD